MHRLNVVVERQIGDARAPGRRAAQLLMGHRLLRHGLDHVGTGDEQVRAVPDHEDEVGHRREYTAPPAHGPMITLICGTTPDASTLRWNTSA